MIEIANRIDTLEKLIREIYPILNDEDIDRIINVIDEILKEKKLCL